MRSWVLRLYSTWLHLTSFEFGRPMLKLATTLRQCSGKQNLLLQDFYWAWHAFVGEMSHIWAIGKYKGSLLRTKVVELEQSLSCVHGLQLCKLSSSKKTVLVPAGFIPWQYSTGVFCLWFHIEICSIYYWAFLHRENEPTFILKVLG